MTFWGLTEHFSGKNGALRWSLFVGKQKRGNNGEDTPLTGFGGVPFSGFSYTKGRDLARKDERTKQGTCTFSVKNVYK